MYTEVLRPYDREYSKQAVDWFIRRFDKSYQDLLYYAAMPLVLTPELLNYLRNRFLRGKVPWIADADLLLSGLCRQVGYEQYIMDAGVRAYLIDEMRRHNGIERMQEVAHLLIHYIHDLDQANLFIGKHELQTQQWAAMAYLADRCGRVVHDIAGALRRPSMALAYGASGDTDDTDQAELMRVVGILQALAPQLDELRDKQIDGYLELMHYAQDVGRILIASDKAEVASLLQQEGAYQPTWIQDIDLPPLATLVEVILPEPVVAIPAPDSWSVLEPFLRASAVRDAVVALRANIRVVREQIDVTDDCVNVLGLLHTLQVHCYAGIVQEAEQFPGDEQTSDNVWHYDLDLAKIIDRAQRIVSSASFARHTVTWLHDLVQAHEQLQAAIERSDPAPLDRAIGLMEQVLYLRPPQINAQLNGVAQALRLGDLVEALKSIFDKQAPLSPHPEELRRLETTAKSLSRLIDEHARWWGIDPDLRRIEDSLEQGLDEIATLWPRIQATAEPLYREGTEPWAISLTAQGTQLQNAVAARNPSRVKEYFRGYRSQAGYRLYGVIKELQAVCDQLRQINKQLADVLRVIDEHVT
jgi:hypothetical protein